VENQFHAIGIDQILTHPYEQVGIKSNEHKLNVLLPLAAMHCASGQNEGII
jgi:hypothetical protein